MKYVCLRCGFKASQRSNLENHLNRKNICEPILELMSIDEVRKQYGFELIIKTGTQTAPLSTQIALLSTQTAPNLHRGDSLISTQTAPLGGLISTQIAPLGADQRYSCEFCGKCFTRNTGLTKHLNVCNKKKMNMKENIELKEEIKELKETMKLLMNSKDSENISNNTINNSNRTNCDNTTTNSHNDNSINIHINNYGSENKDYITKDYLIKLLREPFQAIPRLIEYTHFNKDHPENQNIKLPNKKQPYVKVLKDDKWIYADRKLTILDLIDEKHSELNDSPLVKYVEEQFSEHLQDRFERFNDRYLNEEKDFTTQLYKETELVMINNS